jgi:Phosphotransferase enzyme family
MCPDEPSSFAEERLPGGRLTTVMRSGDTVRRPGRSWNKDVHQLLHHVRDRGFLLVPEPQGFDEEGREILSYIDGDTSASVTPWPGPLWNDELLADVGRAVAQFHRAVADFVPDADARWQYRPRPLEAGEIICHHDFAPYNAVFNDHRLLGIIDWDGAGPGTIQEELAFLAWQWVPLGPPDLKEHVGCDPQIDEGERLRLLLDSYGYVDRGGLIDAVIDRIEISRSGIEERAALDDPPYVLLRDEGYTRGMERTIRYLIQRGSHLQREIE